MTDPNPEPARVWTVAEAKARLSEAPRLAEEEGPRRTGKKRAFAVAPADERRADPANGGEGPVRRLARRWLGGARPAGAPERGFGITLAEGYAEWRERAEAARAALRTILEDPAYRPYLAHGPGGAERMEGLSRRLDGALAADRAEIARREALERQRREERERAEAARREEEERQRRTQTRSRGRGM